MKLCIFIIFNIWVGIFLSIIIILEMVVDVVLFIYLLYFFWLENDWGGVFFRFIYYFKNFFKVEKLFNRGYGVFVMEFIKKGIVLMV